MNKVPLKAILALLGALLYGASPIDLVPDILPLLGLVDDALVIPLLILAAIIQMRKAPLRQRIPVKVRR
ncbi:MAG TPA: DUF1232 domain-containing protein [Fimbriimonas sp.]